SLLAGRVAPAYQNSKPVQYRLTVWTIRPLVKQLPTPQELQKNSLRWMVVQGFDRPQLQSTNDQKILDFVRKTNPLLTIPRIEQKSMVMVPADTQCSGSLPGGCTFTIEAKQKGLETALSDITKTNGKAIGEEFRRFSAQGILIYMDFRIPHLDRQ